MNKGDANDAFAKKTDLLRKICLEKSMPAFFPSNLSDFAEWEDASLKIERFSRPILYKPRNADLLVETRNLIQVALDRWRPKDKKKLAHVRELESLMRMLTSRYLQERQLRLDAQTEVEVLRASVDSLSSRIRDLTGKAPIRLVSDKAAKEGDKC